MEQQSGSRARMRMLTIAMLFVPGFWALSMGANQNVQVFSTRGKAAPAGQLTTINDFTTGTGLNQFEFSSGWTGESQAGNYNNDGHFSSAVNSYYQVRFYGTQIKVFSKTEKPHGIEAISIDGGAETLVDEYSENILYQQNIFASPVLTKGNHILKVRVTGTKNALANNTFIYADRVDIISDTGTPSTLKKMLCLTKCGGFVHGSIPGTVKMLMELSAGNGFSVDSTGNPADINSANLAKYDAVALVDNTGEYLNAGQKTDFENYVKSGKGVFAIHAATDAFNTSGKSTWLFYTDMVGAIFKNHPGNPNVQTATVKVENKTHLSTIKLPDTLSLRDEWYNFYQNVRGLPGFTVLMSLDESTYNPESGAMGDHPIAWYHTYNTSRIIYTGIGHESALFQNQDVRNHFLGCAQYALGIFSTPVIGRRSQPEKNSSVTITHRNKGVIVISQKLPSASDVVKVQFLSLNGTVLRELPFAKISSGIFRVTYGTSGSSGRSVPKGVSILSVRFGDSRVTQKISLYPY